MPLIENDAIFAYLNEFDPHHKTAERIFKKLERGEITVAISSATLLEMELIYISEGKEDKLLKDLAALVSLPNASYIPPTPDIALASVYLRQTLSLSFFNSHYAATALNTDRLIISFDQVYDRIPRLTRVDPESL